MKSINEKSSDTEFIAKVALVAIKEKKTNSRDIFKV